MSDSHFSANEFGKDQDERGPLKGEELLPPVEPPNAGFIVQLFVVPAVIVVMIVGAWLVVSWLVHRTRPEDLVTGLKGSGVARWQRASELADILRNKRYESFKRNEKSAADLAAILRREIEASGSGDGMKEENVMLRFFLCRALGEFEVRAGLDELLLAAETNRYEGEQLVRRGAIQAIAMRLYNLHELAEEEGPGASLDAGEAEPKLLQLSEDPDSIIRSETAFALGRIATPKLVERLEIMADDPHADTRYNAAVALAHLGNAKGVNVLAEMIEPVPLASVLEEPEKQIQSRLSKRATIIHNAMEASLKLVEKDPSADMAPVVKSLRELSSADEKKLTDALIFAGAVSDAKRTLEVLGK